MEPTNTHAESSTLAITVAYEGAQFAGFARQPELRTVQGALESALETVYGTVLHTVGAGRTDAGVHALAQVVSVDVPDAAPDTARLRRSLDALTGAGLVVSQVKRARAGFSARFDAVEREYRYRITAGSVAPLFLERFSWHVPAGIDLEAMREGAATLTGEHDFASFCVTESAKGKNTVRTVHALEVITEEHLGEECVTLRVVGNAFLHSMIRVIAGTLVEVGTGRRRPEWVAEALAAKTRSAAGPTAPPHGLVFHAVSYPDDVWL